MLREQEDLGTFSSRSWSIDNKGTAESPNKVNKSVSHRIVKEAKVLCAIREETLLMKRRAGKLEHQKSDNH